MNKMSLKKETEELNNRYTKTPRPTTLKQACLMSIRKWEEGINIIIKNKECFNNRWLDNFSYTSCGLCKFYKIDDAGEELCNVCPLAGCDGTSIYQQTLISEDAEAFINNAYKLIRKIRKGYQKITGEVLHG